MSRIADVSASALDLPCLPQDGDGPVFAEPWQAQTFALALRLHEQGLFTWQEWADSLAAEITAAQQSGDPDLGDTYYQHWSRALERLVAAKGAVSAEELDQRSNRWRRAYLNTSHGNPIKLSAAD